MAVVPTASASAVSARPAGGAQGLAAGNPRGQMQEVPGTATLNNGGTAWIDSVSCASAGNCSAGGSYQNASGSQAFVVNEVKGTWRKAEEVPGTAALNTGGDAQIGPVSCSSAGNCSAGGVYTSGFQSDGTHIFQAFVVSEVHGRWRKAEEVPGTAALNTGGDAVITSVSCASAGNCSAGGSYSLAAYQNAAFVVSEVHGRWRKAEEVPGTAALNAGGDAGINSVSCASAGNCSAGGDYLDGSFRPRAFVVSEVKGAWQKAEKVLSPNKGVEPVITSVSCASAGNCSAGGSYGGSIVGSLEAFVVSEVHGRWRKAEEVPGTAALNTGGDAGINSVSCASAGNCSAGGSYAKLHPNSRSYQAFVVSEVHGTWRKAEQVPGIGALNPGEPGIASVSCASAGNCSAGGSYSVGSDHSQAFVLSEVHGTWRKAEEVPGTGALNTGEDAGIASVSCASAGNCSAGGIYTVGSIVGSSQAFVVSEVHGRWRKAEEVPGTAALN